MINSIGMIGTGNMGSAILRGIVEAEYVKASMIVAYDTSSRRMNELEEDIPGVILARDCLEVAKKADLIILAVKPIYVREVIDEIRPALNGKAVLSIAAGWTVSMLENALYGTTATYLRVMPNTPALVGEGMTAICDNTTFSKEDFNYAKGIFDSVGKTKVLPERLFDGVVAVSGSSPAYVYMMIEAMADAAAKEGEVRTMDAATLLMDIVSVNLFSFIVAPILSSVKPDMDFQTYYHARCQENVQLILNRINPDIK